jgi:D-alanyl-D-alanine dipeptidase
VRLVENGERMVDIRAAAPEILIPRPTTIPWARESVVAMLREVARPLPDGVRLAVLEAWRPMQRQKRHYDRFRELLRTDHPTWPEATLRRMTNRFFHPYDRKQPPGHCTGGAVDVRLHGPDGMKLDMLSPYERWPGAATNVRGLTPRAAANRRLLVDSMLAAGFSNCAEEFWHYSFGDAAWAVRTSRDTCSYGLVVLPDDLWREAEEEAIRLLALPVQPEEPNSEWSADTGLLATDGQSGVHEQDV